MELLKETIDIAIIVILGLMAFLALLFTIERLIFLRRAAHNLDAWSTQDEFDTALTNNLTTIYIVYSNAPYVGLLGTVVGIMITFYDMGRSASIDASQIMTGLSLALYATALGLVVAIPSLIAYNALNRRIAVVSSRFKVHLQGSQSAPYAAPDAATGAAAGVASGTAGAAAPSSGAATARNAA